MLGRLCVFSRFHRVFCRLHTKFFLETDGKVLGVIETYLIGEVGDTYALIPIHNVAGGLQADAAYKACRIQPRQ